MWNGISIGHRLVAYVSSLIVLVFLVGMTAAVTVTKMDRNAQSIGGRWLAGTRVLDEVSDEVAQFRFAEIDRALARASVATDPDPNAEADGANALAHRTAVERLIASYQDILGSEHPRSALAEFVSAWADYLIIHDAWLRADVYRHSAGLARAKSSLDWRYKAVDAALGQLKATSYQAADVKVKEAAQLSAELDVVVTTSFAVAAILALLVFLDVSKGIIGPLRSMTTALSRLAEGHLESGIPELHRRDEIGQMAKAFEVFRANAADLEAAHARTREAQEQAHLLARHDALTGLPNRRVFATELEASLQRSRHTGGGCALLLIDLDRFKPVNDVQGHGAGDRVLCEVARRLEGAPGRHKTVARLGGDEFAIIIDAAVQDVALDAAATANEVLRVLRLPFEFGEVRVEIGASIGIACWPTVDAGSDLVHGADLAMYRAKHEGRDRFCFFEPDMDKDWREQLVLDEGLRRAVLQGEIEPHYQPLIQLGSEEICGFEVLARWTHPEHGSIPPDRFILMAERLGLISDLTAGVLRRACRDARSWGEGIRLALNVSPGQIVDRTFHHKVLCILAEEDFAPSRLEIEVTESALIKDIEAAKFVISSFQEHGIAVSLDDFGTGYSSLYHLRNLKFDKIKIDKSFVQSLHINNESAKIVDAVLGLARSLGMQVVAEGIEDQAAMAHLLTRGCDYGQGYYFSKAVGADAARLMLAEKQGASATRSELAKIHERLQLEFGPGPELAVTPFSDKAVA